MDGFSIRFWHDPLVEVGSTDLCGVLAVRPEDLGDLAWRFESETRRDNERFRRAWFTDFRERFRADMRAARVQYVGLLEEAVRNFESAGGQGVQAGSPVPVAADRPLSSGRPSHN